jgi:acetyltransferase-like isoleucine patch superfamily enzyme
MIEDFKGIKFIVGKNCKIERGVILGYDKLSKLRAGFKVTPTIIGDNVRIRSGSVIYAGCIIGDNCHIGHNVVLREFTRLGHDTSLGSGVVCEGYTFIGDYTTIHSQTHLTAKMSIGDYVFIGPNVITMNDKRIRYYRSNIKDSEDQGAIIADGVAIGGGAIILPQVRIDMGCIIGAGTLVTKDCDRFRLYIGSPANKTRIVNKDEVVDYLQEFYKEFIKEEY